MKEKTYLLHIEAISLYDVEIKATDEDDLHEYIETFTNALPKKAQKIKKQIDPLEDSIIATDTDQYDLTQWTLEIKDVTDISEETTQ